MSRLNLPVDKNSAAIDDMYESMCRRISAAPTGVCPIDVVHGFVTMCHAQSCGKCVPCRIGLGQVSNLLSQIMDGRANEQTLETLKELVKTIEDTADCAIGTGAAKWFQPLFLPTRATIFHI